ncbi:MAG: diacylglycerol kinase family protein [Aestuariibacter sp.]
MEAKKHRIPIHFYYAALAFLLSAAMLAANNVFIQLTLGWIALSLWLVTLAYVFRLPKIFRKRSDGSIPFYVRWLFIPFLFGASLYNSWARKNDPVPAVQKIENKLFLARRLFPSDVDYLKSNKINAILDVTAEFDGMDWSLLGENIAYMNVPVLDHTSPNMDQVKQAINWIHRQYKQNNTIVIHCALGRGRSVFVMAAYLLCLHPKKSVREVLQGINDIRQTAILNMSQLRALEKIRRDQQVRLHHRACVIANPVSGGGKWPEAKAEIQQLLSPYFHLTIKETTKETSGVELAKQALHEGSDLLIACGGDGTVCEVASVVQDKNTPLAVIPLGTTNALSHVLLGVKSKILPVSTACQTIIEGHISKIDTAICNGQITLLLVGIGFEERMIELSDREEKNNFGQLAYLKGLFTAIAENRPQTLRITLDNEPAQKLELTSLIVANAAPISTLLAQGAGEPDYKDGQLDVTWIEYQQELGNHLISLTELMFAAINKEATDYLISNKQVKRVKISSDSQFGYVIDGERFEAQELDIQIKEKSLNIMVPLIEP